MLKIEKKIKGYAVCTADAQPASKAENFVDDADRRLKIEGCPVPPTASLRWHKRPVTESGNPGFLYMVNSPEGKFAVFVTHIQNGTPLTGTPFEVWVNGEEAPRGLSDLARSLSIDMRSQDRAWLRRKLEALSKTRGEAFELTMPDGKIVRARSAVDAFARLVMYRCEELGAFSDEKLQDTPVIDALMSKREPKTTGDGSAGWYCDVENPATGDEFLLTLKESVLENGQCRPFSVWLSGDYPSSLDGLAKSLSLDMRVAEPAWLARKLSQLIDVSEQRGDFWAHVPGATDGKKASYPSTVAYIAAVITHRFKVLGLFNDAGDAAVDSGVVQLHEVRQAREQSKVASTAGDCGECQSVGSVFILDGCPTCSACGHSKCS